MNPDHTVLDTTVQPIHKPDMLLNEKKKVHANNIITESQQHYLRQWEMWKFYMVSLLLLKVALLPWQPLNHLGIC